MLLKRLITSKLKINKVSINKKFIILYLIKKNKITSKFINKNSLVKFLFNSYIDIDSQLNLTNKINLNIIYINYLKLINEYKHKYETYLIWINKFKKYPKLTKKEIKNNVTDQAKRWNSVLNIISIYKMQLKKYKKEIKHISKLLLF